MPKIRVNFVPPFADNERAHVLVTDEIHLDQRGNLILSNTNGKIQAAFNDSVWTQCCFIDEVGEPTTSGNGQSHVT